MKNISSISLLYVHLPQYKALNKTIFCYTSWLIYILLDASVTPWIWFSKNWDLVIAYVKDPSSKGFNEYPCLLDLFFEEF
jgi:hypothetical protein